MITPRTMCCSFISFILLLVLVVLLPFSSYGETKYWGMSQDAFFHKLSQGDYSFLKGIDPEKKRDLRRLGEGDAYFTALLLFDMELPRKAVTLLEWEIGLRNSSYQVLSLEALAQWYLEGEQYQKIVELLETRYSEDHRLFKHYLEALYWQKEDEILLSLIEEYHSVYPGEEDLEIQLFRLVADYRQETPGWDRNILSYYTSQSPTYYHHRLSIFLGLSERAANKFTPGEFALFKGKALYALGEWKDALLLYDEYVHSLTMDALSPVIRMERGFLLRRTGQFQQAAEQFQNTFDSLQAAEAMRMRWYYFDCIVKTSPVKAAEILPEELKYWDDPAYFSDVLDYLLQELLAAGDWSRIIRIYVLLKAYFPLEYLYSYQWVLLRGMEYGLLPENGIAAARDASMEFQPEPLSYHWIMEGLVSGTFKQRMAGLFREYAQSPDVEESSRDIRQNDDSDRSFNMQYLQGLLRFGMIMQCYESALDYSGELPLPFVIDLVENLQQRGMYRESIIVFYRNGGSSPQYIRLLYPRPYRELIQSGASENGIPEAVLYGLYRTESAFDPRAVSIAGARGLGQLIGKTADDVAGWLRMESYDLEDPGDNIAMSSYYLSRLGRNVENLIIALASYNAGRSRVLDWRKEQADLPIDLFIESIPYTETRDYCRRLLVSTLIYSYVYYNQSLDGTIQLLFGEDFIQ